MTRVVYPMASNLTGIPANPTSAKVDPEPVMLRLPTEEKYDYKLDDGVPPPPRTRAGVSKYPFPDMKLGQSFFVPNAKLKTIISAAQGYRSVEKQKGNVIGFSTRPWIEESKDAEGHEIRTPGVRCWRIK
jgi:hypothetical protein